MGVGVWKFRKKQRKALKALQAAHQPPAVAVVPINGMHAPPAAPPMHPIPAPAKAGLQSPPPAAHAVPGNAPPAAPAKAAPPGFVDNRHLPPPAAPVLANVPHASSSSVEVRGRCDGCGLNVMSNDDGRQREGEAYFHQQCVKGHCGSCGLIVHARTLNRVYVGGRYYHPNCAPH